MIQRFFLLLLLCMPVGASFAQAAEAPYIQKAYLNQKENTVHIIYSDGRRAEITTAMENAAAAAPPPLDGSENNLERFGKPVIAKDRQTVAWEELFSGCCESYAVSRQLAVYRDGAIYFRLSPGPVIWEWNFEQGGDYIAFQYGYSHGNPLGYALYDTRNGKELERMPCVLAGDARSEANADLGTECGIGKPTPAWMQALIAR
jgi:hypothetical protein